MKTHGSNDDLTYADISKWKMPEHCALGLFCILTGVGTILIACDYPYGTLTSMGPGFFPTVIATILILLGIVIALLRGRDVREEERKGEASQTLDRSMVFGTLRVIVCITGGIVCFGTALRSLGLALSTFVLVVLVSFARPKVKALSVLFLAASVTVASCIVFVFLLSLEVTVFPEF
jgi:hypothetical protein